MTEWLANPTKNPGLSDGTLHLNNIFGWYAADFTAAEGSVQEFVAKYTSWEVDSSTSIEYESYDWSLNAKSDQTIISGGVSVRPCQLGLVCCFFSALCAGRD